MMKIGIQTNVWTNERHQDLDGIMREIALAEYDGVEIGAHRVDIDHPETFNDLLEKHSLSAAGIHTHGALHEEKDIQEILERVRVAAGFAAAVHCPFVLISGKPKNFLMEGQKSEAELRQEADTLMAAAQICHGEGVHLLYHNHYWEIEDNLRELRALLDWTNPALLSLALDVAWVKRGGHEPVEVIQKFRGRIRYLHLKDYRIQEFLTDTWTDLGEGYVDLLAIVDAFGTRDDEWMVYERDEALAEAYESARNSRAYLRQMGI